MGQLQLCATILQLFCDFYGMPQPGGLKNPNDLVNLLHPDQHLCLLGISLYPRFPNHRLFVEQNYILKLDNIHWYSLSLIACKSDPAELPKSWFSVKRSRGSLKIRDCFTILTVQKLGQSTLLQLVKVDFQWFDVCGGLHSLFHIRDQVQLIILNINRQKIPKKHPKSSWQLHNFSVMFLTENQLFGSSAGSDLQAIRIWTEIWLVYPLCFSYQNASKKQQKRTVAAHAIMSQLARWVSTQHFDEKFCLFLFSFVARFESSDMYVQ